jgi:hypothetical protein
VYRVDTATTDGIMGRVPEEHLPQVAEKVLGIGSTQNPESTEQWFQISLQGM